MQSALSFPKNCDFVEENFIFLEENLEAKIILEKFSAQQEFVSASLPSLILKGEAACGKTHLLNIFSQKNSAKFLNKSDILGQDLIKFFVKDDFYIFENADEISDDELLLRLVNSAFEAKAFLIISLKNSTKFKLKDLTSRLKNIFVINIKSLAESSIKPLISNGLSRRQINLSAEMVDFIAANVGRNYLAVFDAINKVEDFCHQRKGDVSLKSLKNLF
jgi:chromosomal replication initiation ATPase DnaA